MQAGNAHQRKGFADRDGGDEKVDIAEASRRK